MIEYTTPDFTFRVKSEDADLTQANHVYLTMKQGCHIVTKTEEQLRINGNEVSLWMDQNEISRFKADGAQVDVQLNWTYTDSGETRVKRAATTIKSFKVGQNLLKRVVE